MEKVKKEEIDFNNFINTDIGEQESQINIHRGDRQVSIYSSIKVICKRLIKKLGNPTKVYYTKGMISGIMWELPYTDKNISRLISKSIFIGNIK